MHIKVITMLLYFISAAKSEYSIYHPSVYVSGVNGRSHSQKAPPTDSKGHACVKKTLCEFVYVCVRVLCVFEVRGGVAVCTAAVERFELQQGEGVCEPTASSCSLILLLFPFSYFLFSFSCLVSFSLVFTHTYTDAHNAPRLLPSLSLSGRTGQAGKHTSPQQQQTVKEV